MRRGVGTAMNLCILFRRLKERFRDFDRLRKGARHLEQELSIGNGPIRCLRGSILHPVWCPLRIFIYCTAAKYFSGHSTSAMWTMRVHYVSGNLNSLKASWKGL